MHPTGSSIAVMSYAHLPLPLGILGFFDSNQDQALTVLSQGKSDLVARREAIEHLGIFGLEGHGHRFHQAGDISMIDENSVDFRGEHSYDAAGRPALFRGRICGRPLSARC